MQVQGPQNYECKASISWTCIPIVVTSKSQVLPTALRSQGMAVVHLTAMLSLVASPLIVYSVATSSSFLNLFIGEIWLIKVFFFLSRNLCLQQLPGSSSPSLDSSPPYLVDDPFHQHLRLPSLSGHHHQHHHHHHYHHHALFKGLWLPETAGRSLPDTVEDMEDFAKYAMSFVLVVFFKAH